MTPTPHPVPELIFARAGARSRPGERTDDCRLGLALEGGGMRGVVSAGMACALERLDLLEAFDAVYGSSSGAINGAFFVAGQTDYGIPLYWENIANRRFINYLRLASKTPVLSLEYLLEHVMVREKVLDWQAVVGSPVPLKPVAMSLDSQQAALLTGFRSRQALFAALRASASIPLIAGPPPEIDRCRYIDGGMIEPLSFQTAIEDGCTHVLVLTTLPVGRLQFRNPLLTDLIVMAALKRLHTGLARTYRRRGDRYLADYRQLAEATERPAGPPYLFTIRPGAEDGEVHWFERRRRRLVAGARAGLDCAFKALLGPDACDPSPQPWSTSE